jgi:uncharacterized protein YegP (UPF0339 family)
MYYEVRKSINPFKRQRWYIALISATNGKVIMAGELQSNRQDCFDTINSIKRAHRSGPIQVRS